MLIKHWNLFSKQCLTVWPRYKTFFEKQNLFRDVHEKRFCFQQAKNVSQAVFLNAAKLSTILFDKKNIRWLTTMFTVGSARSCSNNQTLLNIWNLIAKQIVWPFGHDTKHCLSNTFCLWKAENVFKVFRKLAKQILFVKQCFVTWQNSQTLQVKQSQMFEHQSLIVCPGPNLLLVCFCLAKDIYVHVFSVFDLYWAQGQRKGGNHFNIHN